MSYTHLTKTELVFIEEYHQFGLSGRKIAKKLKRGHEAIYRVIRQLKKGLTAIEVHLEYKANKAKCGRKKIQLTPDEKTYIKEQVRDGWTPDVIIGRNERPISCSMSTLYRKFESGEFDVNALPMQGKRKPNGHLEKRGKQRFRRSIRDRDQEHPNYQKEFGHLEGDTIVGISDPGTPSQRRLNEHSNWLLRKRGIPKEMDFNSVLQAYISEVALRRNNIPRKSLNYKTPIECFMNHVGQDFDENMLSRLI